MFRVIASSCAIGVVAVFFEACATQEPYDSTEVPIIGSFPVEAGPHDAAPEAGEPLGTCSPRFCQSTGFGVPCCVAANGPCGMDLGMGCVALSGPPDAN